jgi:predicted phosphodiesterase
MRSSQISHEEIQASPCDYLALGHHHAALRIETEGALAAFCGSPTDTIGGGATYALIDFTEEAAPSLDIHVVDDTCN